MSVPLSTEHIAQLKAFVELVDKQPSIIHHPQLAFFKNFLIKLGTKFVSETTDRPKSETFTKPSEEPEEDPEPVSEESDVELDMTGVIEPDNDDPQTMGDYDLQPTDEQIEESHSKRSEAVSAFVEKDYEKAVKLYTEAIELNPQASLLYAKRGQAYILLNKPNACIRDCDRALELNPDSAAAHKFRGRANQLLGKWEEAASDLRLACKFDFDEQADSWLKEVTPNARKIEEHKRKKERRALEREEKAKRERIRKVREAQAKASEEAKKKQQSAGADAHFGGMPGAGGPGMGQFNQFLNDPEIQMAFQDPEVAAAFKDISSNPSNLFKYQSNPKIMALINKISSKFDVGGMGGMPGMGGMGGMPGMGGMGGMPGMGGFPGAGADAGPKAPPKSNNFEDFNLD